GPVARPHSCATSPRPSGPAWTHRRSTTSTTPAATRRPCATPAKRTSPTHSWQSRAGRVGGRALPVPGPSEAFLALQVPLARRAGLALPVRVPEVLEDEEVVVVRLREQIGHAERCREPEVGHVVGEAGVDQRIARLVPRGRHRARGAATLVAPVDSRRERAV